MYSVKLFGWGKIARVVAAIALAATGTAAGAQRAATAANLIAPLTGKVDFANVSRSALDESAAYRGKYYGVPFAIQTVALFYNKAIFSRYHLSPPHTWEDFLRTCATLKKNGVTPLYV